MRRKHLVPVLGAAVGLALFAWAVDRVGVDAILGTVRRVGWGVVPIIAIAGARFAVRAQCWRWCLLPGVPLDFSHAFTAFLAGDAVGNVTPLGLLASEPTKVLLTRHHLATIDSVASLTLENILYTISVLAMLAFGLVLTLTTVSLPDALRWAVLAALAVIGAIAVGVLAALRAPVADSGATASRWIARVIRLRTEVSRFALEHPARMARVFLLQMFFHVLAVLETFLTLEWLMGASSPTLTQAVLFETVNRLTVVLFKFIPFRIGIDEATSGAAASLFAVTAAAGVALAVVRKARQLFWTGVGLLLIASHPAPRPGSGQARRA
jgi:hypothetical protein